MDSPGDGPGPLRGEGRLLLDTLPPRSFSSRSWCFRSRSSLFLANLLSGTGLKYRSVRLQELPSPLLRCLTKMADCDLWHSVSSTLGSGLGSLLVPGEVPGEVWQSGSST